MTGPPCWRCLACEADCGWNDEALTFTVYGQGRVNKILRNTHPFPSTLDVVTHRRRGVAPHFGLASEATLHGCRGLRSPIIRTSFAAVRTESDHSPCFRTKGLVL